METTGDQIWGLLIELQGGEKLLQLDMITDRLSKQVMENREEMGK